MKGTYSISVTTRKVNDEIMVMLRVLTRRVTIKTVTVGKIPSILWKGGNGRSDLAKKFHSEIRDRESELVLAADYVTKTMGDTLTKESLNQALGHSGLGKKLSMSGLLRLYAKDKTGTTKMNLETTARIFDSFGQAGDALNFNVAIYKDFKLYIQNTRNVKDRTLAMHCMQNPRAALNWLKRDGRYGLPVNIYNEKLVSPISMKPGTPLRSNIFTKSQLQTFRTAITDDLTIENVNEWFTPAMWFIQFSLGGANVGDLYDLKVSDLNFETRYIRTRTRNKTKGQIAPFQVQESALSLIKAAMPFASEGKLLPIKGTLGASDATKASSVENHSKMVNQGVKAFCIKNSLPIVTTKNTRPTFASIWHNEGNRIEQLSKILGHENVAITQRYIATIPKPIEVPEFVLE